MNRYLIRTVEQKDLDSLIGIIEKNEEVEIEIRKEMCGVGDVYWLQWYNEDFSESGELRVKFLSTEVMNEIIISRISVMKKRKGTGSQILNWLKNFAIENSFERVVAESVLSEEMAKLSIKEGFVPDCYRIRLNQNDVILGNYNFDIK